MIRYQRHRLFNSGFNDLAKSTSALRSRIYLKHGLLCGDYQYTLSGLLGYSSYQDMMAHLNERDVEVMRLLDGPHGPTILKILIARFGVRC